jgi:hypothetical protein
MAKSPYRSALSAVYRMRLPEPRVEWFWLGREAKDASAARKKFSWIEIRRRKTGYFMRFKPGR